MVRRRDAAIRSAATLSPSVSERARQDHCPGIDATDGSTADPDRRGDTIKTAFSDSTASAAGLDHRGGDRTHEADTTAAFDGRATLNPHGNDAAVSATSPDAIGATILAILNRSGAISASARPIDGAGRLTSADAGGSQHVGC